MKATILHDEQGKIISISKAVDLKQTGSKFTQFGMVPGRGQRVVEVELSREDQNRPMRDLHEHYRVDVPTSKLVKRAK